jgi:hypothetical protein
VLNLIVLLGMNNDRHSRMQNIQMKKLFGVCIKVPYFSIDNVRVIYAKKSKFVKNKHARYTFEKNERQIKCKVEVLPNIY